MAADDADDRVELTELDVITRYSLAVRHATAPRDELIAALRDDLAWLERGRTSQRAPAARKTAATKTAANKAGPTRRSR